jgi:hypothetical protein
MTMLLARNSWRLPACAARRCLSSNHSASLRELLEVRTAVAVRRTGLTTWNGLQRVSRGELPPADASKLIEASQVEAGFMC